MVTALEPIRKASGLKQVVVLTYVAVLGAGQCAMNELFDETQALLDDKPLDGVICCTLSDKKHYPMLSNACSVIDVSEPDGYSVEEWKMIYETKKIMAGDMNSELM